jgi:SAM-dependent methyltransferase
MRPFWEDSEVVERFAGREPDAELVELIADWPEPAATCVLDLGCAGGRNAELLARRGFDVRALDTSAAMRTRTRERLAEILGAAEAEARVLAAEVGDLGAFADASFRLVVAIGIFHNAASRVEWDRALAETARVLAPRGLLLVASFTPATDLTGHGMMSVPDEPHVYEGPESVRVMLFEPDELDREMARFGLEPVRPTRVVTAETDPGRRVTSRGLYRKSGEARR